MTKLILAVIAVAAVHGLVRSAYTTFMSLSEVYTKIDSLTSGSNFVTVTNSTDKTLGNRSLMYIRVTDSTSTIPDNEKGKILILAQHHAVGLVGASMACYILENLLDRNDAEMVDLLKSKVIMLMPVVNPDSYFLVDSTNPSSTPVLKNQDKTAGFTCPVASTSEGVNLDRNYAEGFTAEPDKCSGNYGGLEAFSEAETKLVRDVFNANGFDLVVSYDKTGDFYILPSGSQSTESFSLSADDSAFLTSFTQSSDFAVSGAKTKTSSSVDGVVPHGSLLDWAYNIHKAFAVQMRLGEDKLQGNGLAIVLGNNWRTFLYLAKRTKNFYLLTPKAVQETYCSSSSICKTPGALSRIQLPIVLLNDVIGTPAPITVTVSCDLPVNSTYLFRLTNVTDDVQPFGSTNYTLAGGVDIIYTNISQSPLTLQATLPTQHARALHVFSVFLERLTNSTTPLDENLRFSIFVAVNGRVSNVEYLNKTYSGVYTMKKPAMATNTNNNNVTTASGSSPYFGLKVGYDEPVLVGLGVLIFILFALIVVGVCSLIWLLNRPPKDPSEVPLNKQPENITSEVPLSPGPHQI